MSWTNPKTWAPGDMVTAGLMNQQVRDNFSILSTHVDTVNGYPQSCIRSVGLTAGLYNAGGGADTALTNYNTTIPAGRLAQVGDSVLLEGWIFNSAAAGAWTAKITIDGGTNKITIASGAAANTSTHWRLWLRRRTQTTARLTGISEIGFAISFYLIDTGALGTIDWNADTVITYYTANATATNTGIIEPRASYLIGVLPGVTA